MSYIFLPQAILQFIVWTALEAQANQHVSPSPPESKPLDIMAVLLDGMCPLLPSANRELATRHYEDAVDAEETRALSVTLRSSYLGVEYFVGLPFVHARYGYLGVIFGWTVSCSPRVA